MKTLIKSFLIIILASSSSLYAQLPDNISELVDQSAPAVVNITAKKEISQRSSFGYGGIPDEMLERFGIPRDFREMPQQRRDEDHPLWDQYQNYLRDEGDSYDNIQGGPPTFDQYLGAWERLHALPRGLHYGERHITPHWMKV